jgi:hypothetical protein
MGSPPLFSVAIAQINRKAVGLAALIIAHFPSNCKGAAGLRPSIPNSIQENV